MHIHGRVCFLVVITNVALVRGVISLVKHHSYNNGQWGLPILYFQLCTSAMWAYGLSGCLQFYMRGVHAVYQGQSELWFVWVSIIIRAIIMNALSHSTRDAIFSVYI